MEAATLGWKPFVDSWIVHLNPEWCNEETKDFILEVFDWMIDPSLYFIRKFCKQLCVTGEICLVKSTMTVFEIVMDDALADSVKKEEEAKYLLCWIQAALVYAGVWGLGGILDSESRERFDEFFKDLWRNQNEELPFPESFAEKIDLTLPQEGLMVDYNYNFRMKGMDLYTI